MELIIAEMKKKHIFEELLMLLIHGNCAIKLPLGGGPINFIITPSLSAGSKRINLEFCGCLVSTLCLYN